MAFKGTGVELCLCLQSTQSCVTWSGEGDATAGKPRATADIEFLVDIDPVTGVEMVHIADPKPQRRQPEFLVRDIERCASLPALPWTGVVWSGLLGCAAVGLLRDWRDCDGAC